ncbi:MAG: mucin desulfatase, partial [Lachnospiraceae bacterium]|nr:mucin desulfatase [Lachnospiraceae bacterium]
MEEKVMQEQAREAVSHFELEGVTGEPRPFGSGHINDTFLVEGEKRC